MAKRISALHNCAAGDVKFGGVTLHATPELTLHQIAAWPDTLTIVGERAMRAAGLTDANRAPGPGQSQTRDKTDCAVLRVAPLKWWLLGAQPPQLPTEHGATLDLSHARARVIICGAMSAELLNRHMALDLRPDHFPPGAVASCALHHIGATLWHSPRGYELFIPRGFALSIWEMLLQTAAQFKRAAD